MALLISDKGEKVLHKEIKSTPDNLLEILTAYIGKIVVGVECMHCWYWIADCCRDNHIDIILGHALYMKAIHGGKAKDDKIAVLMRGGTFPLAYVYPEETRAKWDLLRRRTKMVNYGAQLLANITYPLINLTCAIPMRVNSCTFKF